MAARSVQSMDAAYQMILVVVVFMCSGLLFLFNVYPEKPYALLLVSSCVMLVGAMAFFGVILLMLGSLLSRAAAWVTGISCLLVVSASLFLFAVMLPGAPSRLRHVASLIDTASFISGIYLVDRSVLPAYESAFASQYPDQIWAETRNVRHVWPRIRSGILAVTLLVYLSGLVQFLCELVLSP
jgi:hypothetical protein